MVGDFECPEARGGHNVGARHQEHAQRSQPSLAAIGRVDDGPGHRRAARSIGNAAGERPSRDPPVLTTGKVTAGQAAAHPMNAINTS